MRAITPNGGDESDFPNHNRLFLYFEKEEARSRGRSRREFVERLIELGVPKELAYRIGELWNYTRQVGGKIVKVGRLLLVHITEFVEMHPHAVSGMVLGAALSVLVSQIPGIGPLLAPIVALLGIPAGGLIGAKIDSKTQSDGKYERIAEQLVRMAHDFFKMLIQILNYLFRGLGGATQ